MEIEEQWSVNEHLTMVSGNITQSNFLDPQQSLQIPVLAAGFTDVEDGDRIKMVYFTTRGELDSFLSKDAPGFSDSGLRYFKGTADGWDLIYEDFSPNP